MDAFVDVDRLRGVSSRPFIGPKNLVETEQDELVVNGGQGRNRRRVSGGNCHHPALLTSCADRAEVLIIRPGTVRPVCQGVHRIDGISGDDRLEVPGTGNGVRPGSSVRVPSSH